MQCLSTVQVGRYLAAAALTVGVIAPSAAQADINIVGSTHGQAYQGVANPVAGQAAASIPLSLCDAGGPTPERYQNLANITDLTDPTILIPAGNIVVWRCTRGGVPNFLFRYTGGFSAMAYNNVKAALGSPQSNFTSIVPGGTGCVAVAGNPKTDPGTGKQYNSFQNCSQKELVPANFATSDTKGTAFQPTMCDQSGTCAQTILDTGVTSFPITATAFSVIVGNGVQKCDPNTKAAAGKISLTRIQAEAIYTGTVSSWNQLGYCVYPVQPLNPPDASLGAGAGDMSPIGTPFNPGIDQSIVTCSRPVDAGTRINYDAIFQKDVRQISTGTIGPPFTGDINYLAPTVSDGLACVQGRSAAPASNANMNAITYNRADEAASPVAFGLGNVGRMRGGYPVAMDGVQPSNFTAPAVLSNPSDAERAASQKEFRCGRYIFWADWVGIQRNTPDANQALWNQYVAGIATLLPKTQIGYFHARNLRQPGQPVNTEMFVQKADTKGPITVNPGDHPACY
ncbi:exported protein of unknown function [Nitrospira sp. KM1]|uniref:hypothetical protein n=1 Tax=Nitrospira sp. KM1 TaxID=1936990 RepID=UPI0013A7AE32|nr:hypothetical protein [Nitrospira sp. KM1]BCA57069.1 exported protein of unknown function [Nitrospira sp. KM1]